MNIVIINGSPRKGKYTDTLCGELIKGAEKAGNTVYKFDAAGKKINGCVHCMQCYKNGPCAQKDGMTELYDKLAWADAVVFASPIYFGHISAQLKCIIDRTYCMFMTGHMTKKETALLLAAGASEDYAFAEAERYYKNIICGMLGWTDRGVVKLGGTTEENGADTEAPFEKARDIGRSFK